jgi:Phospholipase_D-nuclease N-terminal
VLAYDYPLLGVFWTILEFFLLFLWILLLIFVFADIFRSADLSGLAKALWVTFVIVLPLLGVLVYLIARGGDMQARRRDLVSFEGPRPAGPYRYVTAR